MKPSVILLTSRQKAILQCLSRQKKAPEDQKQRVIVVLKAAQGLNNTQIKAKPTNSLDLWDSPHPKRFYG